MIIFITYNPCGGLTLLNDESIFAGFLFNIKETKGIQAIEMSFPFRGKKGSELLPLHFLVTLLAALFFSD